MICLHCGFSLPDNSKFCPSCGKNTVSQHSTPSPPSQVDRSTSLMGTEPPISPGRVTATTPAPSFDPSAPNTESPTDSRSTALIGPDMQAAIAQAVAEKQSETPGRETSETQAPPPKRETAETQPPRKGSTTDDFAALDPNSTLPQSTPATAEREPPTSTDLPAMQTDTSGKETAAFSPFMMSKIQQAAEAEKEKQEQQEKPKQKSPQNPKATLMFGLDDLPELPTNTVDNTTSTPDAPEKAPASPRDSMFDALISSQDVQKTIRSQPHAESDIPSNSPRDSMFDAIISSSEVAKYADASQQPPPGATPPPQDPPPQASPFSPERKERGGAKATMNMSQDDLAELFQSMGLNTDLEHDPEIENATEAVANAENLADQGNYGKAIEIYIALLKSYPTERGYQDRLEELWGLMRDSPNQGIAWETFPASDKNTSTPLVAIAGVAVVLFGVFLFLGFVTPGWLRPKPIILKPKTTTRPRTPQPARLKINSIPANATLSINGNILSQRTPIAMKLTAGQYTLKLQHPGHLPLERKIDLHNDQIYDMVLMLSPIQKVKTPRKKFKQTRSSRAARLTITSTPSGALILLNDKDTGKHTPATLRLRRGRYQLALQKEGYRTAKKRLRVRRRQERVKLRLEIASAALTVQTQPAGATLVLDGEIQAKKTPTTLRVPANKPFTIVVKRKGLPTILRSMKLPLGANKTLRLQLDPKASLKAPKKQSDMVYVKGGPFYMGNNAGTAKEKPMTKITLRGFRIDRTEVTVAAYMACVKSGTCSASKRGSGCNQYITGHTQHPINCVTWYQARTYCRWAKKRLPTEAEWEKAARGQSPQLYPWGHAAPSCRRAAFRGCSSGTRPTKQLSGRSPYGAYDMSGNVWEWVQDYYSDDFYKKSKLSQPVNRARGNGYKVIRGGSWRAPKDEIHVTYRADYWPSKHSNAVGFRCAR